MLDVKFGKLGISRRTFFVEGFDTSLLGLNLVGLFLHLLAEFAHGLEIFTGKHLPFGDLIDKFCQVIHHYLHAVLAVAWDPYICIVAARRVTDL